MTVAEANEALVARGFSFVRREATRWLLYRGKIQEHPVSISIDRLGLRLPKIRLLEIPDQLKPFAPHLSSDGTLCYLDESTVVLDVYDQAGQLLSCLQRAEYVLVELLAGRMDGDLPEEFSAYWQGNVCLFDAKLGTDKQLRCVIFHPESKAFRVAVSDNLERTVRTLEAYNGRGCKKQETWFRSLRTEVLPRPLGGSWPPSSLGELLAWQTVLDPATAKKLRKRVMSAFCRGADSLAVLIDAPSAPYGFFVSFVSGVKFSTRVRKRGRRRLLAQVNVVRLTCFRVHDEYVAERSNPSLRTLSGHQLLLVGCGTIGGFLAEFLVKNGAGIAGGELVLVDNQQLLPQNVGRHRLGLNCVFQNKAIALSKELMRSHPSARVVPLPVDALEVALANFDLVIDATGEEGFSHLLARRLVQPKFVPSVTVWVDGPGVAARALLKDSADAACPRCLFESDAYPVTDGAVEQQFAGAGCEALYVPFSVSASTQAACLAFDVVTAWANDQASPRLRTRMVDARHDKATPDCDPSAVEDCPACRT